MTSLWRRMGVGEIVVLLGVLAPDGPVVGQGIHEAVRAGDRARVEALLAADASLLEAPNERGFTPLALALATGGLEMAGVLLEAGADPRSDSGRVRPMDLAFQVDCQRGGTQRVSFLLDHGVELDADAAVMGRPKLLVAIPLGNEEMVRLLLDHGADASTSGPRGMTPLGEAARGGRGAVAGMLLEAGADPDAPGLGDKPPLHWAVERGHEAVVRVLLEAGADPTVREPQRSRTLLHSAAVYGHLGIVEALSGAGADIRATDADGRTPLYFAARYGHGAVARALLAAGALPEEVDVTHSHPSPYLDGRVREGEAAGWTLAHRGLALKTARHFLVFDAEEFGVTRPTEPGLANGFLDPSEIGGQDVLGFYSAYHGNVDEPAYLHSVADELASAAFVHLEADAFRGSDRAVFLSPRQEAEVGGVPFVTVGTMTQMPTLGYLIDVDGLTLYYQGFGTDDLAFFEEEMAFLGGLEKPVDLAILPVPDAGVEAAEAYFEVVLRALAPEEVVLHTPSYQVDILPSAAERLRAMGFGGPIHFAEQPGDLFLVGR